MGHQDPRAAPRTLRYDARNSQEKQSEKGKAGKVLAQANTVYIVRPMLKDLPPGSDPIDYAYPGAWLPTVEVHQIVARLRCDIDNIAPLVRDAKEYADGLRTEPERETLVQIRALMRDLCKRADEAAEEANNAIVRGTL
jgi:hypothetical protein